MLRGQGLFSPQQAIARQQMIFVIGGPGSGKGTHCELLVKEEDYVHISSGDLVRAILNEPDRPTMAENVRALRAHIREVILNGGLLPGRFIVDLVLHEIQNHPHAKGFLIDGCPRTIEQANIFHAKIKPCDLILFFDTSEAVMKQRMEKRREAEHRLDDNDDTFNKRLATYREETLPMVDHLKTRYPHIFRRIDSSGSVEDVARAVTHAIKAQAATSPRLVA